MRLDVLSSVTCHDFSRNHQARATMSSTRAISGLVVILTVLLFLVHWIPSGMILRQLRRCMRRNRDAVPFAGHIVAKSTCVTLLG